MTRSHSATRDEGAHLLAISGTGPYCLVWVAAGCPVPEAADMPTAECGLSVIVKDYGGFMVWDRGQDPVHPACVKAALERRAEMERREWMRKKR